MEFFEVVRARRSVRKFTATQVPEEVVHKAIDAALIAPNSSNMQPWEFYWVRSPEKKKALVAHAFSQPAAGTAAEIVVAVARTDTWRRNQRLMLERIGKDATVPKMALDYYRKVVPMMYNLGPFGIFGPVKRIFASLFGIFRPVPRGPYTKAALFETLSKTTALACENLMLSVVAQGYGCCPMEGYDEQRVKSLLGLGRNAHIVMMIGIGQPSPNGVYGEQIRFDRDLFFHEV